MEILKFPKPEPRAEEYNELIFNYILQMGEKGATEEEISCSLGKQHNGVRYRCYDLARAGRIVKAPFRRKLLSGRTGQVWLALMKGDEHEGKVALHGNQAVCETPLHVEPSGGSTLPTNQTGLSIAPRQGMGEVP